MVFTKRLREGVRRGRIRCSVRIWTSPHVKAGGRYPMDEGQIVVDSIVPIRVKDITDDLARESGFSDVKDLLQVAKHGTGKNVYLIRFHYLAPGAWDVKQGKRPVAVDRNNEREGSRQFRSAKTPTLLERIRSSRLPALAREGPKPPGGRRGKV